MKNPESPRPLPPATDAARTSLDWPSQVGVLDRVLDRLEEKVKKKNQRRRRIAAGSTAVATVLLAVLWLVPLFRDTDTITSAPGQHLSLTLADGSRVDLNAQTSLHTDFRYGRRRLRLDRGEAFFSVVKDSAHPFLVRTAHGTVRVTGTVFNVRLAADGRSEVTLHEGSVQFEAPAVAPLAVISGQQLSTDGLSPKLRDLSPADMENLTAWRQGRLVLDGLTLAQVASRLAAYHGAEIVVAPEVAQLRPGGTVPLSHLGSVLDALQDALPIRVERRDGTVRITAR